MLFFNQNKSSRRKITGFEKLRTFFFEAVLEAVYEAVLKVTEDPDGDMSSLKRTLSESSSSCDEHTDGGGHGSASGMPNVLGVGAPASAAPGGGNQFKVPKLDKPQMPLNLATSSQVLLLLLELLLEVLFLDWGDP